MQLRFGNVSIFPHNLNFDFMKWRWLSIGISTFLIVSTFLIIAVKGINYSIDFLGGAEVTLRTTDESVTRADIEAAANKANIDIAEITSIGAVGGTQDGFVLKIAREEGTDELATSKKADELVKVVKEEIGADKIQVGSVTNISGKVGGEEQRRGYFALILSFIGILIYVAFRFDSRFAPGAIICLIHDVIVALGVMTLLGKPFTVSSIAAYLTIVGYSCNDTIVIYDRIREIQAINPRMPITQAVNMALNQTMNRTVLTSTAGLGALLVLTFFGGGAIEDFALTMLIGILVGTYSSVYVAAPLTIVMDNFFKARGWFQREVKAKKVRDPNYIPPVVLKKKS